MAYYELDIILQTADRDRGGLFEQIELDLGVYYRLLIQ